MRILVTGGSGLVGNAIKDIKNEYNDYTFVFTSSKDYDLTDPIQTKSMYENIQPTHVIHLAARVGGLYDNILHQADFLTQNVLINTNVLKYAKEYGIKKLVSCLSTCIFPKQTQLPITIDNMSLHSGPPHDSNYGYAYSKRLLHTLSRAYNEQYNTNFCCVVPTNVFGKHDNFNQVNGHVIGALINKCNDAKKNGLPLIVYGDGTALRQFVYSKDLANILMKQLIGNSNETVIVAPKEEIPIKYVAELIAEKFGVEHIEFDKTYISGQYKKTVIGIEYMYTPFKDALAKTIDWYITCANTRK